MIGSKVPGISELVINNFNGFFCESKNVNSLYRVILKVSKIDKKGTVKSQIIVESIQKNI